MRILAIETSGLTASVALADGDQLYCERVLDTAGRRNARLLAPAVLESLQQVEWQPADVDVVAVSVGPGSFTGLRVGIVFAKTFAWVNAARLVPVDTLQGLAQRIAPVDQEITVISDAQRGDVFVNSYHCQPRRKAVQPCGVVRIATLESVLDSFAPQQILTGPAVLRFRDRIPDAIAIVDADKMQPRAHALLPAAGESIARQHWSDLDSLEPVYLRRSYAEEKRNTGAGP